MQTPDFFAEKKYFQEHKDQGQFLSWPIVGSLTPPSLVPPASRKQKAETLGTWDVDHITYKMSNLTSFLRTKSDTPVVIYMHCEAGVDRTGIPHRNNAPMFQVVVILFFFCPPAMSGEMSGNYMMAHYPNMTWAKALQIDDNVEPRAIASASQNGMNWFCLFLYYSNPVRTCPLESTSTKTRLTCCPFVFQDFQGLGCPGEK